MRDYVYAACCVYTTNWGHRAAGRGRGLLSLHYAECLRALLLIYQVMAPLFMPHADAGHPHPPPASARHTRRVCARQVCPIERDIYIYIYIYMKRVRALIMRKDVAASHILPGLACSAC